MSWKVIKRLRKKCKLNIFNFFWFLLIFLLVFWLFNLDVKTSIIIDKVYKVPEFHITVENGKELNQQLQAILHEIQNENKKLKDEIEGLVKLEAKFESLDKSIDMISNYIALFAILITVISIFFSLRESSRIDEYIEKYEDEVELYKNELNSLDGKIKSHFDTRKKELDKQINTIVMNRFRALRKDLERKYDTKASTKPMKKNKTTQTNTLYSPTSNKDTENRN